MENYANIKALCMDGGNAQVFVATHKHTKREVVIKQTPKTRQQLATRERKILARLHHPNVIELYEHFDWEESLIVVLEKAEGDLMDKLTREERFSREESARMFKQLCQAVLYCHHREVAHLDIKPENIFLDKQGNIKLGDFDRSFCWKKRVSDLVEGRVGTVYYAAPEVGTKAFHASKADSWSLGVVLHMLLTGMWPFHGRTYEEVEANARRGRIGMKTWLLDSESLQFLQYILVNDPARRPSVGEILAHPWFRTSLPAPPRIDLSRLLSSRVADSDDHRRSRSLSETPREDMVDSPRSTASDEEDSSDYELVEKTFAAAGDHNLLSGDESEEDELDLKNSIDNTCQKLNDLWF